MTDAALPSPPAMDFGELAIYFENEATDAMGHDHVSGKLRSTDDAVFLHWKVRERTFAKSESELRTIELAYADIESARAESRFFRRRDLVLRIRDPRLVAAFPGADVGEVTLAVERRSKQEADSFIKRVDYKLAEIEADRLDKRLDDLLDSGV